MSSRESDAAFSVVRSDLQKLGYTGDLLQEDYAFNDVIAGNTIRKISLAAFGQRPLSYRTACLGVTVAGDSGPGDLSDFRALGAPQILVIHPDYVSRWKVRPQGQPEQSGYFSLDSLLRVMREHREEWGPAEILRGKSISFDAGPMQLDFFDVGLIPAIEEIVQDKLDRLLRQGVAATKLAYSERHLDQPDPRRLFRLIFRLLAAKVFHDRGLPGTWIFDEPWRSIAAVEQFYHSSPAEPVLADPMAQETAWRHIRDGFHFQNISMETLAYVYENTLVSPEVRQHQSIHSTPFPLAQYIIHHLPFEAVPEPERHVFEPFTGCATFLIASLGRLRDLLSPDLTDPELHAYFAHMLAGIELDPFAIEVARLSLMLADYPNPDGWRLLEGDVFRDVRVTEELSRARIVLCNPPFEDFTQQERDAHKIRHPANKAAEILERVLTNPPQLLGFVLPRTFADGRRFRSSRKQLVRSYRDIELVELPDQVFAHSEAETILLLAHGASTGVLRLHTSVVHSDAYARFAQTGEPSYRADGELTVGKALQSPSLRLRPLDGVWRHLNDYPQLQAVSNIHNGIEYRISLRDHEDELVSTVPRQGFDAGLARVTERFEPYLITSHVYLNVSPELMRGKAYQLPWSQPKVIVNANRRRRGHWKVTAVPDETGLVAYQLFHGIWPTGQVSIEALAAILNGPIANAFVSLRRTGRNIQVQTLRDIPIPRFRPDQLRTIGELIGEYRRLRQQSIAAKNSDSQLGERIRRILLEIDAEVLTAYDLPPRLERDVLNLFIDEERPVPFLFTGYYPPGFRPALPLRLLISGGIEQATVRKTLERLPTVTDEEISGVLAALDDADS